jgi:hypothetical protein
MPAISRHRHTAMLLAGLLPPALTAGPAPARANDRDLLGTTVPPPACLVAENYGVPYPAPNGGYFAVYGPERYIRLTCPLPINNVDLSGKTDDNDMSKARVYYRDGDGYGLQAGASGARSPMALDLARSSALGTRTRTAHRRPPPPPTRSLRARPERQRALLLRVAARDRRSSIRANRRGIHRHRFPVALGRLLWDGAASGR